MPQSPRRLKQQVRDAVGEQIRDLPINAARLAMFGVGRALLLSDRVTKDVKEMRESGVMPVLDRLREDVQHATTKTAGKVVSMVIERVGGAEELEDEPVRPGPAATGAGTAEPRPARRVNTSLAAGGGEISVGKPVSNGQATRPATTRPAAGPATAKPVPRPAQKPAAARPAAPQAPRPAEPAPPAAPAPAPASEVKAAEAKAAEAKTAATTGSTAKSGAAISAASLPVPGYDEASVPALRARLRGLSVEQVGQLLDYERANAARPDVVRMYENRIAKLAEQA